MSLDKMLFDEMLFDKMSFDKMSFDKMSFDKMSFDKMSLDEMLLDEMSLNEPALYQRRVLVYTYGILRYILDSLDYYRRWYPVWSPSSFQAPKYVWFPNDWKYVDRYIKWLIPTYAPDSPSQASGYSQRSIDGRGTQMGR
jgi:hypothetical protein